MDVTVEMLNSFDISHLSALRISGPDALRFCQGQLTFDVNQLTDTNWQPGAWCDTRGRCLIVILARLNEGCVEWVLPRSQIDLVARLKMFSIGHRIEIGPTVHVRGCFGSMPQSGTYPGRVSRSLKLDDAPPPSNPAALHRWRLADLATPLPWLQPTTSGQHLPQFLGLEDNKGLSYTKGCYPGQEVIARVHYLGKVKRQLLGFSYTAATEQPLEPGTRLGDAEQNEAGEVVDCVLDEHVGFGLAVCPIAVQAGARLMAGGALESTTLEMALPETLC